MPESYTNVKPAYFPNKPSPHENELTEIHEPSKFHLEKEYTWLEMVHLTKEFTDSVQVTWSAHNAAQIREQSFAISMSTLMPLLRDQAHEMPTIKHVMDKVKKTTSFLNPTQTPVIIADQPLFALAKHIQWHWPDEYGNFVIMMGALHIEIAALRMVGRILKGSGWTRSLACHRQVLLNPFYGWLMLPRLEEHIN